MKPKEEARKKIDVLLEMAGWLVQDYKDLDLGAATYRYLLSTEFITLKLNLYNSEVT